MLSAQWGDAPFGFASLTDRAPVRPEDDVIVLAAPDPPGADKAIRIAEGAAAAMSAWGGVVWCLCCMRLLHARLGQSSV